MATGPWVITATHTTAHVKPAKEGAATNMNLVTASGAVYSFLLTEKGGTRHARTSRYVNADPSAPQGKPSTTAQHSSKSCEAN